MKNLTWTIEKGLNERNERITNHLLVDEDEEVVAVVWSGRDYYQSRCFLEKDGKMVTASFFYADSDKEGKARIMALIESNLLDQEIGDFKQKEGVRL